MSIKVSNMIWTITVIFVTALISCQPSNTNHNETIEVAKEYSEIQTRLDSDTNVLWIVNFWATSCPPCLKEMPHFNEIEAEKNDDIKILLVSLDRAKDLEPRVYDFVEKFNITPEVVLLEDQNYSSWTDDVDPSWYGALPATMMIKGSKKNFRFGAYKTIEELQEDVDAILVE